MILTTLKEKKKTKKTDFKWWKLWFKIALLSSMHYNFSSDVILLNFKLC